MSQHASTLDAASPKGRAASEDHTGMASAKPPPRVIVIILMYGHADDAIEAISSVLGSDYPDYRIILLDNASPDGAYDAVKAWAEGAREPPSVSPLPGIAPVRRGPVDHTEHRPEDRPSIAALPALTLVQTGANLGYAGGNNVALRWLIDSGEWDYAWILNPDAAIDPSAMAALVARAAGDPQIGLVGARILDHAAPYTVHCRGGGGLNRLTAKARLNGLGAPADAPGERRSVERALRYVGGASLFLTPSFLKETGPMEEKYFLYYEEIDWAFRRGRFTLAYAPDAIVYHKHGASIGSSTDRRKISPTALYWGYRNRFVFTRKFSPWALPTVFLGVGVDIARTALTGNLRQAWQILLVALGAARPPAAKGQPPGG